MSQAAPPKIDSKNHDGTKTDKPSDKKKVAPPEQAFWIKYSPHHEFPLSTVASVGIHVLVFGMIAMLAWWLSHLVAQQDRPPDVRPAEWGDDAEGGGRLEGSSGTGPGGKGSGETQAETGETSNQNARAANPSTDLKMDAPPPEQQMGGKDFTANPHIKNMLAEGMEMAQELGNLDQKTRAALSKNLAKEAGGGVAGGGGGAGGGTGTGVGNKTGAGTGGMSRREARVLRWAIIFETKDGGDYIAQLKFFGAILAIADPADPNQFLTCDLAKDIHAWERKDISDINRIFWIDSAADSVERLSGALGLKTRPSRIIAFFPPEFEQNLATLEFNWRKRAEEKIKETRFRIVRLGGGRYEARVIDQR